MIYLRFYRTRHFFSLIALYCYRSTDSGLKTISIFDVLAVLREYFSKMLMMMMMSGVTYKGTFRSVRDADLIRIV